jgi:hypothetical protein
MLPFGPSTRAPERTCGERKGVVLDKGGWLVVVKKCQDWRKSRVLSTCEREWWRHPRMSKTAPSSSGHLRKEFCFWPSTWASTLWPSVYSEPSAKTA